MSDKKIIAVVGATGSQGNGLVRAILEDPSGGFAVRALTRDANSDKGRALAALGAEVVSANVDDRSSLERAFAGAHESPITWMGVVEGDGTTTVDRCLVVVTAGSSAPTTDIEAVVRCLARP